MKIGYARVSTDEQRLDLQIEALKNANCDKIITDHGISGANFKRQGLTQALSLLNPGDTLVVWRLDRLGRSLIKLIEFMNMLHERDLQFQSLNENIDTGSSGGRLVFHMMAALAEFERSLISERTKAGMAAARKKGKQIGRPRALSNTQRKLIRTAVLHDGKSLEELASDYNVSVRSIRRAALA
ncbi:recombinase family protein [Brucellaceae bacterium D45D]